MIDHIRCKGHTADSPTAGSLIAVNHNGNTVSDDDVRVNGLAAFNHSDRRTVIGENVTETLIKNFEEVTFSAGLDAVGNFDPVVIIVCISDRGIKVDRTKLGVDNSTMDILVKIIITPEVQLGIVINLKQSICSSTNGVEIDRSRTVSIFVPDDKTPLVIDGTPEIGSVTAFHGEC